MSGGGAPYISRAARRNIPWSPAQDTQLRQLVRTGIQDWLIARMMARTRHAITGRRRVLGIKQPEGVEIFPPDDREP